MSDCFPHEFLCGHTLSKSRVHAVLVTYRDGMASSQLKAVLTCSDPGVAEDAAAVLTATAVPELAGADMISHEVTGQVLDAAAGDEVVPWHAGPVIEEFDAGWLLDTDTADSERAPDFVALFPVRDCDCGEEDCEICGDWHLTPRTADMLHAALSVMSDQAYDDIEEHGDTPVSIDNQDSWMVFDRLPRITWRQDAEWRRGIAHACEGPYPRPGGGQLAAASQQRRGDRHAPRGQGRAGATGNGRRCR